MNSARFVLSISESRVDKRHDVAACDKVESQRHDEEHTSLNRSGQPNESVTSDLKPSVSHPVRDEAKRNNQGQRDREVRCVCCKSEELTEHRKRAFDGLRS